MIEKLKGEDILPHIGRKGVMKRREEGREEERGKLRVDSRQGVTKRGQGGGRKGKTF